MHRRQASSHMQLPFTVDEFFHVFRQYNETVWPAQVLLLALALAAILLVFGPRKSSGVLVSAILALLWAWLGIVYHLAFFTRINPLAYAFAALSLAGAAVFVWQGVVHRRLRFAFVRGWRAGSGVALIVFALVVYPAWSWWSGHRYPAMPTFGLPCPTTLYTMGLLALAVPGFPRSVLVVPLLWCLVGAQAAVVLGVAPDLGLVVAAFVGLVLYVRREDRLLRS